MVKLASIALTLSNIAATLKNMLERTTGNAPHCLIMQQGGEFDGCFDDGGLVWSMVNSRERAESLSRMWTGKGSPGERFTMFALYPVCSYVDGVVETYDPARPVRAQRPPPVFNDGLCTSGGQQ
jgi:hypothetical protein